MAEDTGEKVGPIFRDIRRYYCEYCGICRSKRTLITSHILAFHKDELEKEKGPAESSESGEGKKLNTCEECGAAFKKPAHLKQHMQSHSLEPFIGHARIEFTQVNRSERFSGKQCAGSDV